MSTFVAPARGWMFWIGCALLAFFFFLTLVRLVSTDETVLNANEVARLQGLDRLDSTRVPDGGKKPKILEPKTSPLDRDWPQWRGPARDGRSSETGLNLNWSTAEPTILWRTKIGDGFGSIAVSEGRVYTLFQDGDQEVIGCFDADKGTERWRRPYAAKFKDEFGTGPRSTPTIADGQVFAVGGTGIVHCLDAADGSVTWRLSLEEQFGATTPRWGFAFSPLVVDDLVLINPGAPGGNSLAALERKTGKVRWRALDVGGGFSSPVLADLGGQRQAIFFTSFGLVSVVPDSGAELWRFPWTTEYDANIATPIVLGDYVFISSGYGAGCALVRVEKGGDGAFSASLVYKSRRLANHFSSSIHHDGFIYGFNDLLLVCLDVRQPDKKARWSERPFHRGSLLLAQGHLIVLGENGLLGVVEATPTGYVEKGRMQLFNERLCWSAPALAGGKLYARDRQELVCLDLRKK